VEKLEAHVLLKLRQEAAGGGLGQAHLAGGAGDRTQPHDGVEIP
jgi:hypothetical protein